MLSCGHGCALHCGVKCQCPCDAFTGAYPNDEAWDDDGVLGEFNQGTTVGCTPTVPFIGSDGRVGRIRGSRNRPRNRRGGSTLGEGSTRITEPQGHPVRPYIPLGRNWAKFDAQQYDEQRRRERLQSTALAASNPLHTSPYSDCAGPEMISSIQETFRQVTLNPHGKRNVQKRAASDESGTPSPEKDHCGSFENGKASERVGHMIDTSSNRRTVHVDLTQAQRGPTGESFPSRRDAPNGHFASHVLTNSQKFMANQEVPARGVDEKWTMVRNSKRVHAAENRAEWEDSSTVCGTRGGNANLNDLVEETEGNLIEL